jgi:hypothetical protein
MQLQQHGATSAESMAGLAGSRWFALVKVSFCLQTTIMYGSRQAMY